MAGIAVDVRRRAAMFLDTGEVWNPDNHVVKSQAQSGQV
jgi:hypothetical protein